jgi:hypothetical protein
MDLDKWFQYAFSSSLLRDGPPRTFTSFTFKKVRLHFDRRNIVTSAQVPNSPVILLQNPSPIY